MKTSLITWLSLTVLAAAALPALASAQAQGYTHDMAPAQSGPMGMDHHDGNNPGPMGMNPDSDLDGRISHIKDRIDRGFTTGALSRHEVRHFNGQLNQIIGMKHHMEWQSHGHLDPRGKDMLNHRLDDLSAAIHFENQGDDHHWGDHNGH